MNPLKIEKTLSTNLDLMQKNNETWLHAERYRLILWLPVILIFWVAALFEHPLFWQISPWLIGPAWLAVTAWLVLRKRHLLLWLLWVLLLGILSLNFRHSQIDHTKIIEPSGAIPITATVSDIDVVETGYHLILTHVSSYKMDHFPRKIRLTVRTQNAPPPIRSKIKAYASLSPYPAKTTPFGFDFGQILYWSGVGGMGFAYGDPVVLTPDVSKSQIDRFMAWRFKIIEKFRQRYSFQYREIALAFLLGEQDDIDAKTLTDIRISGLSHLLSVSGFHLSLVAGIVFTGLRIFLSFFPRLVLFYPVKKWAAFLAIFGMTFYLFLVGAPSPAVRSYLMVVLVLLGVMLDRTALSMRGLGFAAFIITVFRPDFVLTASFQLSFITVMVLIAYYEHHVHQHIHDAGVIRRGWHWVVMMMITSLLATAAAAPLTMANFGKANIYGTLANMLAVPLSSIVIMPMGLMGLAAMPLGLDHYFFQAMDYGIQALVWIAHQTAALPYANLRVSHISEGSVFLMVLGIIWICIWQQRQRWLGLGFILVGAIIPLTWQAPDIWIEARGKIAMIRDGDDFIIQRGRGKGGEYVRQNFAGEIGRSDIDFWPTNGPSTGGKLVCDQDACWYRPKENFLVSFIKRDRALERDCQVVDMIVSAFKIDHCTGPKMILDGDYFKAHGATLIDLSGDSPKIESSH